jgi:hypothetical protein
LGGREHGQENSVDWIFSHAVLEHVDDLQGTYRAMADWLKPDGYASHLIDFFSHNLAKDWNGHWAIGEGLWHAIRGKRPYLLNRAWYGAHLELASEAGFQTILEKRNKRFDGLTREQLQPRFGVMTDEDARTRMVFVVQRRAVNRTAGPAHVS